MAFEGQMLPQFPCPVLFFLLQAPSFHDSTHTTDVKYTEAAKDSWQPLADATYQS